MPEHLQRLLVTLRSLLEETLREAEALYTVAQKACGLAIRDQSGALLMSVDAADRLSPARWRLSFADGRSRSCASVLGVLDEVRSTLLAQPSHVARLRAGL